jgi:hypothetical protein
MTVVDIAILVFTFMGAIASFLLGYLTLSNRPKCNCRYVHAVFENGKATMRCVKCKKEYSGMEIVTKAKDV